MFDRLQSPAIHTLKSIPWIPSPEGMERVDENGVPDLLLMIRFLGVTDQSAHKRTVCNCIDELGAVLRLCWRKSAAPKWLCSRLCCCQGDRSGCQGDMSGSQGDMSYHQGNSLQCLQYVQKLGR